MLTDPHFSLPRLPRFDSRDDDLSTTPLSRIAREHGVGAEAVDMMLANQSAMVQMLRELTESQPKSQIPTFRKAA